MKMTRYLIHIRWISIDCHFSFDWCEYENYILAIAKANTLASSIMVKYRVNHAMVSIYQHDPEINQHIWIVSYDRYLTTKLSLWSKLKLWWRRDVEAKNMNRDDIEMDHLLKVAKDKSNY